MKRRLARICVFLFLGAIVNVAVASYISLFGMARARVLADPPPLGQWTRIDAQTPFLALPASEAEWLASRGLQAWQSGTRFRHELFGTGRRGIVYARDMSELWGGPALIRVECGWPSHSLTGAEDRFTFRKELSARVANLRTYRPIWSGIAINTVFYAAMLYLTVLLMQFGVAPLLRSWRGRRRIRRGLCPKCAYDLRGSESEACPECGNQVAPMTVGSRTP